MQQQFVLFLGEQIIKIQFILRAHCCMPHSYHTPVQMHPSEKIQLHKWLGVHLMARSSLANYPSAAGSAVEIQCEGQCPVRAPLHLRSIDENVNRCRAAENLHYLGMASKSTICDCRVNGHIKHDLMCVAENCLDILHQSKYKSTNTNQGSQMSTCKIGPQTADGINWAWNDVAC